MSTYRDVCAVVVTYHPDADLTHRLEGVLGQVGVLIVVDNTPGVSAAPRLQEMAVTSGKTHLICNGANRGVAAALNQGLEHALALDFDWILTLDQDTSCGSDMTDVLLRVATGCGIRPAVVGSNYFDARGGNFEASPDDPGEYEKRWTVITSGSLIEARFAQSIGGFREDYFVDYVDHEFCLRARAHGRTVVITRKPIMEHTVGDRRDPSTLKLQSLSHPPVRQYYIARNTVALALQYSRQFPGWCARHLAKRAVALCLLATADRQGVTKVRAFCTGIMDGLRGRMGPCRVPWLLGGNRPGS